MISLRPVVDRLTPKPTAFNGLWFKAVGGAAEYAQVMAEKLPLPRAWIVRYHEKAVPAGVGMADDQVFYDVVFGIDNIRNLSDFENDEKLLAYRRAVNGLLLGWQMPGALNPTKFWGGGVIDYSAGVVFWFDRYSADAQLMNFPADPDPMIDDLTLDRTGDYPA